jgi:hypothetical protein
MKFDSAKIFPHILCILILYALTIIYFSPEFFENKGLIKPDIVHYEGGSKEVVAYNRSHNDQTLWTGAMFSGMPAYLLHAEFSEQPVTFMEKLAKGIFFHYTDASWFFAALICSYIGLLCFGVSPYLALIGAVSFALSTYNLVIIGAGHITKIRAIAYAPLVLGGMFMVLRKEELRQKLLGFAVFAMGLALELRANHIQITYYLAVICVIFGLSELFFSWQNKQLKPFFLSSSLLIFAAILALGTAAGRLMITAEYGKYSTRGKAELSSNADEKGTNAEKQDGLSKEYAFGWSQGIGETLTLLIPNLYGGSSNEKLPKNGETYKKLTELAQSGQIPAGQVDAYANQFPLYWGNQPFTSAPVYAGAIVCFLFVLGMFVLDNRLKFWLLGGFLITMMFSWGSNLAWFNYAFFDYLPGFNKFRSVSMALSLSVLVMAIIGVLALQKVLEQKFSEEAQKQLSFALGATAGFALLMWLMGSMFFDFATPNDDQFGTLAEAVKADRKAIFKSDALRAAFFIILAGVAIWLHWKNKVSAILVMVAIGFLSTADVWGVGKRYVNDSKFQENVQRIAHQKSPADEEILKDKDLSYRVMNFQNPFNDSETSYWHKSVGGYFAAKLRRYQELFERQLEKQLQQVGGDLKASQTNSSTPNFQNYHILNMLNARYFKFGDEANAVLRNPAALGNAWFVQKIETVESPDAEMASLDKLNTKTSAVIDTKLFPISQTSFSVDSTASIRLNSYSPKELQYESNNTNKGFAVFSEIYYPEGFDITIDGQPTTCVRVNYVLRGMEIPAGKHQIRFVFNPKSYATGSTITSIACMLLGLCCVAAIGFSVWKKQ